jgi:hypothetical protein
MTGKPLVVRSVNNADGSRCVDIFRRANGTYGFEEYRRDPEDSRGWFAVGGFAGKVWPSETEAWSDALSRVAWLEE